MKRSKTNHYNLYFGINWNNLKNTWKKIKSILSIKPNPSDIPKILNTNDSTITNPVEIANVFNNYFSCITSQTKVNIKYSHKHFSDFLKQSSKICFLSPTDKHEVALIISSLDSTKAVGPNSIPTTILKLLKNDISCQLTDIFKMLFTSGVFPSTLQIAKVVPVHKKDSKLDFSNYQPISSLLSNLDIILEKILHTRIFKLFNNNNLFYPLQFGFRQNFLQHML